MKKIRPIILTKILFATFVVISMIPALQMFFLPIKEKPLQGAVEIAEPPVLSVQNWFNESLQSNTESWLNQHFGFRNFLVRLYNQMSFWFYNKASARGVIIGKQDYLYEENYIKAYYGRDYVGDSLLNKRVTRLKTIQDTLQAYGKTFFVVIAPGKGQFYPDFIPDNLKSEKSVTNYQTFIREAKNQNLNLLDFNALFLSLKNQSPYPLYPKTGIHWSHYGMDIFIDSMLKYVEKERKTDLPDYIISPPERSTDYKTPDTDIEDGMNLLFKIPNQPLAYSDFKVDERGKKKLKIMVISDSFFWQIYNLGFMSDVFDDGEFWYYNNQIFQPSHDDPVWAPEANLHVELLEKDVVMLLTTDANLPEFPWNFDVRAYDVLADAGMNGQAKREGKIQGYISAIRNTQSWLEDIKRKALERSIPLDSMIRIDAVYMVEMEENK